MNESTRYSIPEANGKLNMLVGNGFRRADARRIWRDESGVGFDQWADMPPHLKDALGRDAMTAWLDQPWDDQPDTCLGFTDMTTHIISNVMTSLGDTPAIERVMSYARTVWAGEIRAAEFDIVPGATEAELSAALAEAVEEDHPCSDVACDVRAALEAECPWTAAALLLGATECDAIGGLCEAQPVIGERLNRGPFAQADWQAWSDYHDEHGVECPECSAFNYGDESWRPDTCGNCLATLPVEIDPDDLDLWFEHMDSGLRFRWNGSQTVNVFQGRMEIDVFTFSDPVTVTEVRQHCAEYVGRSLVEMEVAS